MVWIQIRPDHLSAAGLHGSKMLEKVINRGFYKVKSLQRIHNFILPTNSDKVIIIAIIESIEVANPSNNKLCFYSFELH